MAYGTFMMCFPILLVVTPDVSVVAHGGLFIGMLIFSFTVVAANFAESPHASCASKCWLCLFGLFTAVLPVLGAVNFATHKPGRVAPPIPWHVTAFFDYGWFTLLGLTVVFLPPAPALKVCQSFPSTRPRGPAPFHLSRIQ